MNKPVAWNFALSKQFDETVKPMARKLANTVKGRRTIEVTFINYGLEEVIELGEDPFQKGHYTWKPF